MAAVPALISHVGSVDTTTMSQTVKGVQHRDGFRQASLRMAPEAGPLAHSCFSSPKQVIKPRVSFLAGLRTLERKVTSVYLKHLWRHRASERDGDANAWALPSPAVYDDYNF